MSSEAAVAVPSKQITDVSAPASSADASGRYVWYVIGLLAFVNLFNYMDRVALSILMPAIRVDLRLSDGQLGLLVGLAFSLFYALCGIPIARWADRGIRRNIIAIALTCWSCMTVLSGAAQNFWQLFVARMGLGVGEAGCLPTAQAIISDYVPYRKRSGVFAIHASGLVAGVIAGMVIAGWLGETVGWRWTFVVLGAPGLVIALIVRLTLREPRRGAFDDVHAAAGAAGMSFGAALRFLWRCHTYRLLAIFGAANGFLQYGMQQWWPSFYSRVFGLSLSEIGFYLGLAVGGGCMLGMLFGGLLANWATRRDVRLPLIIAACAIAVTLPLIVVSLFVPSLLASMTLVTLSNVLWGVGTGPIMSAIQSIVTPNMRATASSMNAFFVSAVGFGLGPFCVGLVSDILTPTLGNEALRYALIAPICLLPVVVIALFCAAQRLPADLKAAGTRT
jgi:predicted MFS family arabinose efflux permease